MSIQLRGGFETEDPRLDRLPEWDERNYNYPAVRGTFLEGSPVRNMTWPLRTDKRLDQGDLGACVGYANGYELLHYPAEVDAALITDDYLRRVIYCGAQGEDHWQGESQFCGGAGPHYEGTSMLAGAKMLVKEGWVKTYRWCYDLGDILRTLSWRGPVLMGTWWYAGMMQPDQDGFIHASGQRIGGHAYLLNRNRMDGEYVEGPNTWGDWGPLGGRFRMKWSTLERLMVEGGEALVYTGRRARPPKLQAG